MTVSEGVLEKISEGEVISSEGTVGYFSHRMGITRFHPTGVDRQAAGALDKPPWMTGARRP